MNEPLINRRIRASFIVMLFIVGAVVSLSALLSLFFDYTGGFASRERPGSSALATSWLQLFGGIAFPALVGFFVLPKSRRLVTTIAMLCYLALGLLLLAVAGFST